MKIIHILHATLAAAACLMTSCESTVDRYVPAAAGTATGSILVDPRTSVSTCSRIVRGDSGRWTTGPEGIAISTHRSGSGSGRWVETMEYTFPSEPPPQPLPVSKPAPRREPPRPEPSSPVTPKNYKTGSEVF